MSFTDGSDPTGARLPPTSPSAPLAASGDGLFGSVAPRDLRLATAIEVAFRSLGKPAFVIPILVIAILISAVTEVFLGASLAELRDLGTTRPTVGELTQLIGAVGWSLLIGLVGGALAAIYGTVWAVAASIGPAPTFGATLALVRKRGLAVLGTSIVVGIVTTAAVLVGAVVVAFVAQASAAVAFGLAMALIVVLVWLVGRMYLASWLAADGVGVRQSLRGSWRITEGHVLKILGWTFAYGFVIALVEAAAGAILGHVPYVGSGVATGLGLALSYGAGVTLFRKIEAISTPPSRQPSPTLSETPFG